jgi:hypothetical protein
MDGLPSLMIDVRPGDLLKIGLVRVELVRKSGQVARLHITAPAEINIKKQPSSDKENRHKSQRQAI